MIALLNQIGKADKNMCVCGAPQNAVHLLSCVAVGDGKGRSMEESERDGEWHEAVYKFVRKNMD